MQIVPTVDIHRHNKCQHIGHFIGLDFHITSNLFLSLVGGFFQFNLVVQPKITITLPSQSSEYNILCPWTLTTPQKAFTSLRGGTPLQLWPKVQ